jgi:hypothetical protein
MTRVTDLIMAIILAVCSFLSPVKGDFMTLLLLFCGNFFIGLLTALVVERGNFEFKKAWRCVVEAMVFFGLVAFVFAVGHYKNAEEMALECVSFITYSVFYFYTVNIIKNLRKFGRQNTPYTKCMNALYSLLTVEFVKKLPFLAKYAKDDDSDTDPTNTNDKQKEEEYGTDIKTNSKEA